MVQVGCAGILVADTFAGPLKALPGEGQLITLDSMLTTIGGCAANVACDLTKQAISVGVAGCVGDDPSAEIVRGELEARGVDCQQVKTMGECPTSQTVVIVVEGQDRRFIHVFGANGMFSVDGNVHQSVSNGNRQFVRFVKIDGTNLCAFRRVNVAGTDVIDDVQFRSGRNGADGNVLVTAINAVEAHAN